LIWSFSAYHSWMITEPGARGERLAPLAVSWHPYREANWSPLDSLSAPRRSGGSPSTKLSGGLLLMAGGCALEVSGALLFVSVDSYPQE
jgi:hypothetical protein